MLISLQNVVQMWELMLNSDHFTESFSDHCELHGKAKDCCCGRRWLHRFPQAEVKHWKCLWDDAQWYIMNKFSEWSHTICLIINQVYICQKFYNYVFNRKGLYRVKYGHILFRLELDTHLKIKNSKCKITALNFFL